MLFVIYLIYFIVDLAASTATTQSYDCRPGQACWPSLEQWQGLNETTNGNLYQTIPMGAPCYKNSEYYDTTACGIVDNSYNNSIPRGSFYGQTYWANWEACKSSGCSLLASNPTETLYKTCSVGTLATYYVDVRNASHISAALRFAAAHNIRISIKNTGHDFFGRSVALNSLAIWTHNLDGLDFYKNFTASKCLSANGQNIGEIGAGVIAGDAYRFFNSRGMDVTGGAEESVGIAGGFAQGGGLGSYTTTYGLMVDNAIEFEVVTADGRIRIINECTDSDLFWAMRGGGGGTYAVLTKYRVQVYPSLPLHVYSFSASFKSASNISQNKALREIMTVHARSQVDWSAQLVTGTINYLPAAISVDLRLPYGDNGEKLKSATSSFAQYLGNRTDLTIVENEYRSYTTYTDYLTITAAADAKSDEPPGIFSVLSSRLITRDVFNTSTKLELLVDGVIEGLAQAKSVLDLVATQVVLESPLTNLDSNNMTSALPIWRNTLWHVIHTGQWPTPLSPTVQKSVNDGFLHSVDSLRKLTPGGGAYFNEAHYDEPDWEETFFGSNYDRLLNIKNSYDPGHMFDCWKCVGWRGHQDAPYTCYSD